MGLKVLSFRAVEFRLDLSVLRAVEEVRGGRTDRGSSSTDRAAQSDHQEVCVGTARGAGRRCGSSSCCATEADTHGPNESLLGRSSSTRLVITVVVQRQILMVQDLQEKIDIFAGVIGNSSTGNGCKRSKGKLIWQR